MLKTQAIHADQVVKITYFEVTCVKCGDMAPNLAKKTKHETAEELSYEGWVVGYDTETKKTGAYCRACSGNYAK